MSLASNTKLGPYEILAPLGAGGMGEVYRARDTRLDRDVAIKVLPKHLSSDTELRQRLEREAKAISQLAHPHICTLHDIGHQDGTDFLVMELLEGETLAQRITRGALPLDQVLKLGAEIASALDAAHRKGVIHRDLKPGNVILTKTGAKLLDFGLAKATPVLGSDPSAVTVSQPLTSRGVIVGTFQYMAPEQLEGKEADARTDIFSLGAVLYETVTGKRAFEGSSRASLIVSIMATNPRPLRELQPMSPPALDRLIQKCLAKDPDRRWQSAADVGDELLWIATGPIEPGGSHGQVRPSRARGMMTMFAACGIVALLSAAAVWNLRPVSHESVAYLSIPTPRTDTVDGELEKLLIALSPDGQTLVYSARRGGETQLFARRLDQPEPYALNGTSGGHTPFFSPDGQWIGFVSGSELKKIPVRGGATATIAETGDSRGAVWLADDTIVVSPSFGTPLKRMSAAGGQQTDLTHLDKSKEERTHRWPDVLPGGEWVIFTVGTNANPSFYEEASIEAVSLKTGERRVLIRGGNMARYSAPGHLLYARGGVLYAVAIDTATATLKGQELPVLTDVAGEWSSGAVHMSVSRGGTLAYLSESGTEKLNELVFVDRTGSAVALPAMPNAYSFPRLSPDEKQILVTVGPGIGRADAWRFDLERNLLTQLTFTENGAQAFWMPDGKRFAYVADTLPADVFVQDIERITPPTSVARFGTDMLIGCVAPDGSGFLVSEFGSPEADIAFAPADGSNQLQKIVAEPGQQSSASLSPDGKWFAYTEGKRLGLPDVFVRRMSSGAAKWRVSRDGGYAPLWSRDGKEIFFLDGVALYTCAVSIDGEALSLAAPTKLFDLPPGRKWERGLRPYDVSSDGQRFILVRPALKDVPDRQIRIILHWPDELAAKVPRTPN